MGLAILVLGFSGSGKSASLRNFKEDELALVNVNGKQLPFRTQFKSTIHTDNYGEIERFMKAQHKKQEQSDKVKQCPECFYTFSAPPAGVKVCCPHCGYEFPSAERKLETDSSVGLVKVEGFKLDFSSPADCHTYPELLQYAKSHGYKSGWAYYQARQRGLIG